MGLSGPPVSSQRQRPFLAWERDRESHRGSHLSHLSQEAAFRKVVQATMVRERQHGPVVELNRIQVRRVCASPGSASFLATDGRSRAETDGEKEIAPYSPTAVGVGVLET